MHEATRDHIHDLIDTDYDNSLVAELWPQLYFLFGSRSEVDLTKAVSTPVPVANRTLATRALESGLRPHDDRPLTGREPFAPS